MICNHNNIRCLNPYEFIRKYRCDECCEVMMCQCDEDFGRKFLSHQLKVACELSTQERIPVTLGFQKNICNSCRGLLEEPAPKAEGYGRATKILRYYWREIYFETTIRFQKWLEEQREQERNELAKEKKRVIEKEVIEEIKILHNKSPKYSFKEESQDDIIKKYKVEIINIDGYYIKQKSDVKAQLLKDGKAYLVEDFAADYFRKQGYSTLFMESRPFHVLFGVFMWMVIQDGNDQHVRAVMFGDREAFDNRTTGDLIWTLMPDDFGTSGYFQRRKDKINKHLESLVVSTEEFLWTFDYWLSASAELRQYLWAHRENDITVAREIIKILPVSEILKILRYLIFNYWDRYCGWPDLLVYRENEFFFVEVKSSGDTLSKDQKKWIKGNSEEINIPFKLFKIHKKSIISGL